MPRRASRKRTTLPLLPSLADAPTIRLSNRTVMRATWRDPTDNKPSAVRTVREVRGFMTYCPLRRMRQRHGMASCIRVEHILAADRLRRLMDAATIGFTGLREMTPVTALFYGPLSGPNRAALKQARAWRPLLRALRLFNPRQRELLVAVVLSNMSLQRWCNACADMGIAANPAVEKGKLLAILDVLVTHFASEIKKDLASSAVLAAG